MVLRGKLMLYRTLRSSGIPLHSLNIWRNLTAVNSCVNHVCSSNSLQGNDSISKREYSIIGKEAVVRTSDLSWFDQWKLNFGFKGKMQYTPLKLKYSALMLYISASEAVHYNRLYDYVNMPDSFAGWHKFTSLHIWLIMVRLSLEGREGLFVQDRTIENLIADTKEKSGIIGREIKTRVNSEDLYKLHVEFLAALGNYDEGLLGSDKDLAGGLWRSLFSYQKDVDPRDLEKMVQYIRKQVQYLQSIPSEDIFKLGLIPFLPVEGNVVANSTMKKLQMIRTSKHMKTLYSK